MSGKRQKSKMRRNKARRKRREKKKAIAPSSNGRTPDFESGNAGSTPAGAASRVWIPQLWSDAMATNPKMREQVERIVKGRKE